MKISIRALHLITCSLFVRSRSFATLRNQDRLHSKVRTPRAGLNDRFSAPSISQPSILDVARPLMNAAVNFERAGSIVVSLSGSNSENFKGGSQLINTARDLEDAGALSRMRPGIFMEEPQLKLRASAEALVEASTCLHCPPLSEAGRQMALCGEELGRIERSLEISGIALERAGAAVNEGCVLLRDMQATNPSAQKVKDKVEKAGWMSGFGADLVKVNGEWNDAIASLELAGLELEKAGEILKKCRVAKSIRG